ncbi:hypothetical protein HH214_07340 [Mucilaginibacter robiniae]|uniref:Tail specific protease domain-containing protein n=1 Tax=Mucilaginibacter robiniae TaxID=2728022 RepID=A0A7L5E015_9SPHI|nr:S41 family peptidase [Mucilaginibacter robiniae]QJD95697.1 hypothetical protein HH214_07340 [Mucilaginibacter robiniae]
MKKKLSVLIAVASFPLILFAQKPLSGADSARKVIDTIINYARAKSIYRNHVNWTALTDSINKHSAHVQSVQQVMPSVSLIYELLGDYHGFVSYNRKIYKWRPKKAVVDTVKYKSLLAKMKQKPAVEARMLEEGYGYLLIPTNNPTQYGEDDRLAQQIQDSLTTLHPEKLKGLVIDLRTNPGGDMYPMILGVGNLLGNGKLGSFVDPVSHKQEVWGIKGKAIYTGTDTVCRLNKLGTAATKLKVVVLIGPNTASSAEATVISFMGRKNTWFVGEKTGGYTTANQSFRVWDLNVFMATGVEADRNGKVYLDYVLPNQFIIAGDDFNNLNKDAKVIAALAWLHHQ